mgnify:CR=1 FL=1
MVLYKHSFRARKVVQMMDFERKERREKSAALIRVGHPKQKKEGKIARLKNYIKSSYRSRCCCCREEKRRKERESKLWCDRKHPSLFLVIILLCLFYYSLLLQLLLLLLNSIA